MTQEMGLIGLAVMGQNLALNIAEKGFSLSVFNRTSSKVTSFLEGPAQGQSIQGYTDIIPFIQSLKKPRKVLLMVKAGEPVDTMISQLRPLLEPGDIIIDGGNSHFSDTTRRVETLKKGGIFFIGMGISGGEEGARHGPSIMPGGTKEAWPHISKIFQAISAHVNNTPCCSWIGEGGAGHFVKTVHNGIEYADMQLIAETYDLLYHTAGCSHEEMAEIFDAWNKKELNSYLIEITASILKAKDHDGSPLLEKVVDIAGQKGTGKWTVQAALDLGIPVSLISEAVFMRCISGMKETRKQIHAQFPSSPRNLRISKKTMIKKLKNALYAAKIISYAQGFLLMQQASQEHQWNLDLSTCSLIWRGGCIIRSRFLDKIAQGYRNSQEILILQPFFKESIQKTIKDLRYIATLSLKQGIPLSCFTTALLWYDAIRSERLPTNMIQAQRDCFGAHLFERIDHPRGEWFHATWS